MQQTIIFDTINLNQSPFNYSFEAYQDKKYSFKFLVPNTEGGRAFDTHTPYMDSIEKAIILNFPKKITINVIDDTESVVYLENIDLTENYIYNKDIGSEFALSFNDHFFLKNNNDYIINIDFENSIIRDSVYVFIFGIDYQKASYF